MGQKDKSILNKWSVVPVRVSVYGSKRPEYIK